MLGKLLTNSYIPNPLTLFVVIIIVVVVVLVVVGGGGGGFCGTGD